MRDEAIGRETLRRLASVQRYNDWLFDELRPHVGQRILEVGCGIGNMTTYFIERELIVALDVQAESLEMAAQKFPNHPNLALVQGDIADPAILPRLAPYEVDTVVCLNVLEHIKADDRALRHMLRLLKPGGQLLLFVPAGMYLYGTLDEGLHHWRRYEREALGKLVAAQGFEIVRLTYMNLAGIPGWWLNSRVLKRKLLPRRMLGLFNTLTPFFIWFERSAQRIAPLPVGQSLLCIARKPG
jgi:2-polyprenyl-3-methyl-5-hydroxy-6-metoxy-1,4-benzoquinol methylase